MNNQFLQCAIEAAKKAAPIARSAFGSAELQVITKKNDPGNLVTKIDVECERAIVATIKSQFPDHSLYAEEETNISKNGEYTWYVDPIDGTSNFTLAIPWFGISIALTKQHQPIVGVLMNPISGELLTAVRGEGAFCTTATGEKIHLRASTKKELYSAIVSAAWWSRNDMPDVTSRGKMFFMRLAERARKMRYLSSVSLDVAHVGRGYVDVMTADTSFTDIAAALLIVEEAGGRVTDEHGQPLSGNDLSIKRIVATNGLLHEQILQLM